MSVMGSKKFKIKEFLAQTVLIVSVGIVLGTNHRLLSHPTANSAKKNFMVVRVGEVSTQISPRGDLSPARDWTKLFFEEP